MQSSKFLALAEEILAQLPGKAGHIDDLVQLAIEKNANMNIPADTLKQKLGNALAAAIKKKETRFAKVAAPGGDAKKGPFKRGQYRLKQARVSATPFPAPPKVDNSFVGRAGDYAVMAELLFWGFNVSLMSVDHGIDIVAEKDGHYYHLQVKTASENDGYWRFGINAGSFEANHKGNTYYVFVLRQKLGNLFLVLPSSHLDVQRKLGLIKGDGTLSIGVSSRDKGKTWVLNQKNNVTLFMGAFGQII